MSEKRFRITTNPMSKSVAFDEKQKKHYIGAELGDLLNELSDENEQLKQQLVDVTKSIDSLCNRVDKSNRSNEFKWGAIMGLRTLQRELKGDGV